jgi:hypothetical protein
MQIPAKFGGFMRSIKGVLCLVVFLGVLVASCTTAMPVTSNINDFVMMGIKTSKNEAVSLRLVSNIHDGEYPVLKQNGEDSGGKVNIAESTALQNMLKNYMSSKFANLTESGTTLVAITIKDFSYSYYTTESTGMQVLRGLAGTTAGMPCVVSAKISVTVDINRDGVEDTKNIISTAEQTFVTGTAQVYQKEASDCINSANNKVLMMLNSYFEELQL